MEARDLLLVAIRWTHGLAAIALIGGSAFCWWTRDSTVAGSGAGDARLRVRVQAGFREIVDLSLIVFLISGALLTFERLSSGAASSVYVVVLGLKILVSVLLYRWAFQLRRSGDWGSPAARLLVGSGLLVVLLASVLKTLYENGLRH